MQPLFATRITYIHTMFFRSKCIFIQVSWGTVLTGDVLDSTTTLQSINSCINALFKRKLRSSTLQIFCTYDCILIRQMQLSALWFTGHGIGYNVQRSLPVQYSDGQFIHPFEPTFLMSTKIWLCKYMLPWFVISINHGRYTVYVTPPFEIGRASCRERV